MVRCEAHRAVQGDQNPGEEAVSHQAVHQAVNQAVHQAVHHGSAGQSEHAWEEAAVHQKLPRLARSACCLLLVQAAASRSASSPSQEHILMYTACVLPDVLLTSALGVTAVCFQSCCHCTAQSTAHGLVMYAHCTAHCVAGCRGQPLPPQLIVLPIALLDAGPTSLPAPHFRPPSTTPFGPVATCSAAGGSDSIAKMMSDCRATSAGEAATWQPGSTIQLLSGRRYNRRRRLACTGSLAHAQVVLCSMLPAPTPH